MCVPENTSYLQATSSIAAILSTLAAIFSGLCAFLSYKLSSKIRDELKSDENLIVSKIDHPGLGNRDHDKCVLWCTLFNKSKRKTYVKKVNAYDKKDNLIRITWSNHIDDFGNPLNPCELIGITDTETLFLRQNQGEEIDFCKLEIFNSFSDKPLTVTFDSYAGWN